MKIRNKSLLFCSTVIVIMATTLSLTSCASVSKDILDNLVSRGNGTMFGSTKDGGQIDDYAIDNVIQRALVDPTASKAFKKAAVDQILYN
jgi:hypothetical protein